MIAVPDTTARLLAAIQNCGNIDRVVIGDGKITYLPIKTRETSVEIERAGLSEAVQLFVFPMTRKAVEGQFRPGSYDVSGRNVLVLR